MRSVIVPVLASVVLLSGCDRQSATVTQGSAAPAIDTKARDAAHAAGLPAPDEQGVIDRKHAGDVLPSADFIGVDGQPLTLDKFRGRPILLNLWATWCGPCVAEMPKLDALAAAKADTLMVVTISQDLKGKEAVGPWWAAHQPHVLLPYTDPKNHILGAVNGGDYTRGSLPTSILYDREGREVWRMMGSMDWTGPRAAELLAEGMK